MVNPNGEESKPSMPAEPLCVSCKNLINPGATKCTHCGSYQRRWLSLLLLITGLSGFLAIVASSVSVLYTFLHDAYVLRDPVSVIHYSYKKGALFSNFSHSPIYIKSMFIVSSNNRVQSAVQFSVQFLVYGWVKLHSQLNAVQFWLASGAKLYRQLSSRTVRPCSFWLEGLPNRPELVIV